MTRDEFISSISEPIPPAGIGPLVLALWYDAKGDWHMSHSIAQDIEGPDGALIHAYLHRKEGDIWNADYWYRQAGKKRPDVSLEKEFDSLLSIYLE